MKAKKVLKNIAALSVATVIVGGTLSPISAVGSSKDLTEFGNVLNVKAVPTEKIYGTYSTNDYNNFSDQGAWHGYYYLKQQKQLTKCMEGSLVLFVSQKNTHSTYLTQLIRST